MSPSNPSRCGLPWDQGEQCPCAYCKGYSDALDGPEVNAVTERAEKAEANYRSVVERVADQRLDGYRELAAKCATLETERDEALTKARWLRAKIFALAEAWETRCDTGYPSATAALRGCANSLRLLLAKEGEERS